MFKDTFSAMFVVLILVVGGLIYLFLPDRLNSPVSGPKTGTTTERIIFSTTSEATSSRN